MTVRHYRITDVWGEESDPTIYYSARVEVSENGQTVEYVIDHINSTFFLDNEESLKTLVEEYVNRMRQNETFAEKYCGLSWKTVQQVE